MRMMGAKRRMTLTGTATVAGLTLAGCRPSVSTCSGACARLWPPVTFTEEPRLNGIPASAIGDIMTKVGICQATINGRAACTYANDTAPGQVNGQGVGGTRSAMAPDGSKAGGGLVPGSPGGGSGSYGC